MDDRPDRFADLNERARRASVEGAAEEWTRVNGRPPTAESLIVCSATIRATRGQTAFPLRALCETWRVARFRYDPTIVERFPTVVGGVINATGVANGPTPPALAEAFRAEAVAVRARLGDTPLSELPTLAAWRRVFRRFGVDPTQYRSAAEALLRRLMKQGELPVIGALVDLANLVSIRYALPVAVFDQRGVSGGTLVRFARGDERWADLGSSPTEQPEPGEVIFTDEADVVSARRWCWRQSAASAAREDTTEVLVTIEGHHETAVADVTRALDDLETLLRTHAAPATVRGALLTVADPVFE